VTLWNFFFILRPAGGIVERELSPLLTVANSNYRASGLNEWLIKIVHLSVVFGVLRPIDYVSTVLVCHAYKVGHLLWVSGR
jgi:hypothetical protein